MVLTVALWWSRNARLANGRGSSVIGRGLSSVAVTGGECGGWWEWRALVSTGDWVDGLDGSGSVLATGTVGSNSCIE